MSECFLMASLGFKEKPEATPQAFRVPIEETSLRLKIKKETRTISFIHASSLPPGRDLCFAGRDHLSSVTFHGDRSLPVGI